MLAAGAKEIFSLYRSWNLMKCEMEMGTISETLGQLTYVPIVV